MKNRIIILLAVFLSVTVFKCENDDTIVSPLPGGIYDFTSFDENGDKLVEGVFSVLYNDSKTFKGSWEFKAVGNLDNPRPQAGTGELLGEIDENDLVVIDLNPGWRDNNAYLTGKFENGSFKGDWSWVGFTGIQEKGTFTAKEK